MSPPCLCDPISLFCDYAEASDSSHFLPCCVFVHVLAHEMSCNHAAFSGVRASSAMLPSGASWGPARPLLLFRLWSPSLNKPSLNLFFTMLGSLLALTSPCYLSLPSSGIFLHTKHEITWCIAKTCFIGNGESQRSICNGSLFQEWHTDLKHIGSSWVTSCVLHHYTRTKRARA